MTGQSLGATDQRPRARVAAEATTRSIYGTSLDLQWGT